MNLGMKHHELNLSAPDMGGLLRDVLGRVTRIERDGRSVQLGLGAERSAIALLSRFRIRSSCDIVRRRSGAEKQPILPIPSAAIAGVPPNAA